RSLRLPIFVAIEVQRKLVEGLVRSRADELTHQRPRLDRDFQEAELTVSAVAVLVVFDLRRVTLGVLKRPRSHGRKGRRLRCSRLAVTGVAEDLEGRVAATAGNRAGHDRSVREGVSQVLEQMGVGREYRVRPLSAIGKRLLQGNREIRRIGHVGTRTLRWVSANVEVRRS